MLLAAETQSRQTARHLWRLHRCHVSQDPQDAHAGFQMTSDPKQRLAELIDELAELSKGRHALQKKRRRILVRTRLIRAALVIEIAKAKDEVGKPVYSNEQLREAALTFSGPPPIQWTDKCLSFSSVLHPRWSQKLPLRQRRRGVEGSRDPPRLEAPRQPEGPKGSRCLRVLHFEVDRRLVAQR